MAGQCWNGRADDKWRPHNASQRRLLRWQCEMWLMARNLFGRRRLQLKRVEIGTTKGSTSEHKTQKLFTATFKSSFPDDLWNLMFYWCFFYSALQIREESNVLQDGTLIDLCGATLLWRSAEGLQNSPVSFSFLCDEEHARRRHFLTILSSRTFRINVI